MTLAVLQDEELQRRIPATTDWRSVVECVEALPSFPGVVFEALQLIDQPNVSAGRLCATIGRDVGLATRVLRIANSALFMRAAEIKTLPQAVTLLGLQTLRGLILAASVGNFRNKADKNSDLLWRHAVGVALLTRFLAQRVERSSADELFVCGLLHNVGQILLAAADPELYELVLEEIEVSEATFVAAEDRVLGVSHPIVGAMLLRRWSFAPHFARVTLCYAEDADQLAASGGGVKVERHALMVKAADAICHAAGIGSPQGYPCDGAMLQRTLARLGFEDDAVEELKRAAVELIERDFALYH